MTSILYTFPLFLITSILHLIHFGKGNYCINIRSRTWAIFHSLYVVFVNKLRFAYFMQYFSWFNVSVIYFLGVSHHDIAAGKMYAKVYCQWLSSLNVQHKSVCSLFSYWKQKWIHCLIVVDIIYLHAMDRKLLKAIEFSIDSI